MRFQEASPEELSDEGYEPDEAPQNVNYANQFEQMLKESIAKEKERDEATWSDDSTEEVFEPCSALDRKLIIQEFQENQSTLSKLLQLFNEITNPCLKEVLRNQGELVTYRLDMAETPSNEIKGFLDRQLKVKINGLEEVKKFKAENPGCRIDGVINHGLARIMQFIELFSFTYKFGDSEWTSVAKVFLHAIARAVDLKKFHFEGETYTKLLAAA